MPPTKRLGLAGTAGTEIARQPLASDATRWRTLRLVDVLVEIARNETGGPVDLPARDGNAAGDDPAALRGEVA